MIVDICVACSAPENSSITPCPPTSSPLFHMPKGVFWLELFVLLTFCHKPNWVELGYEKIKLWVKGGIGAQTSCSWSDCLVSEKGLPCSFLSSPSDGLAPQTSSMTPDWPTLWSSLCLWYRLCDMFQWPWDFLTLQGSHFEGLACVDGALLNFSLSLLTQGSLSHLGL